MARPTVSIYWLAWQSASAGRQTGPDRVRSIRAQRPAEPSSDGRGRLDNGGFELVDRVVEVLFVGTGSGLLQAFRRLRHAPSADTARRAHQRMGRRRGERRLRAGNTFENDGSLPDENIQNFAFELAIAERHAGEMIIIDDRRLLL